METELTIEEKAICLNLAMQIEVGSVNYLEVLKAIKQDPTQWVKILNFWAEFNEMTRNVVKLLSLELEYIGGANV